MNSMMKRLWNDEEAANAVEYGLMTAVIAIALLGGLYFFRDKLIGMFRKAGNDAAGAQ